MSLRESFPQARLPSSHFFITIARGARTRTYAVRRRTLHVALFGAALCAVWCLAATAYVVLCDDVTGVLAARQTEVQYAYEDRLAELRNQLDRATSRQLLDRNALEGTLRVLLSRQAQLEARASTVASLADQASLGRDAAGVRLARGPEAPASAADTAKAVSASGRGGAPMPADSLGFAPYGAAPTLPPLLSPAAKPRPEDANQHDDVSALEAPASASGDAGAPLATRLARLSNSLDRIEAQQIESLMQIAGKQRETASRFDVALAEAGLSPSRLAPPPGRKPAVGGPFVPLRADPNGSAFDRALYALQDSESAVVHLRAVLPYVPFRRPFVDPTAITSGFGPRVDPFTGRAALHTGIDFGMAFGAPVHCTAAGRVIIAGPDGGYGNLVEIEHGNGLSTRYGHLSEILVAPGQWVESGAVIGNVGSTGRATGPHLHYETRIDGEAVDPIRFLKAGQILFAAN
jgi:murein DD-endopeptidase MepM/ murein hydrolase activator NlpD